MTTILITGANRGIGLELTRQYAGRGDTVIACCRNPEDADELRKLNVDVLALDVTSDASVKALKASLGDRALDILINNAGTNLNGQSFEEMDFDNWEETFRVNSIGPFRVAQALIDNLLASDTKKLITISSKMGSVDNVYYGGSISYSSSKSAVNMVTKILANRFADDGLIAVPLHPEWVCTDMGGPQARISPEESAAGLIKVIDGLTLDESGRFFQYDGEELPW